MIFPVSFHVRFVLMTKHQCRIKYYTSKKGTGSKHALSSVQSLICDLMDCSIPGFPVHQQLLGLLKLMLFESVMPPNHLILCCPLLLLPSIFPSFRVFSNYTVSFSFPILLVRACNTVSNRYNDSEFLICF